MERTELEILSACQTVMGRGVEIAPRGWHLMAQTSKAAYTYEHREMKLCPLGALLITRNVPVINGAIFDAAHVLNVSAGWIVGFCRGFDEGKLSHSEDMKWFLGRDCSPLEIAEGRKSGVKLRRIFEKAAGSLAGVKAAIESEQNLYGMNRGGASRVA